MNTIEKVFTWVAIDFYYKPFEPQETFSNCILHDFDVVLIIVKQKVRRHLKYCVWSRKVAGLEPVGRSGLQALDS